MADGRRQGRRRDDAGARRGGETIYGLGPVLEALQAGRRRVHAVWLARGREGARIVEVRAAAERSGTAVQVVEAEFLDARSGGGNHQGVVAQADVLAEPSLEAVLAASKGQALLLALDGIQDPQNLGAVLRSAAAARIPAVILPRDRSVRLTPAAVKVAEGAAEHVAIVTVTNLARALEELKTAGLWVVGLAADAPTPLWSVDLKGPAALVLGAEDQGIRRLVRDSCDQLASLPLIGPLGSINVAAAAAVVLYEAGRQRQRTG